MGNRGFSDDNVIEINNISNTALKNESKEGLIKDYVLPVIVLLEKRKNNISIISNSNKNLNFEYKAELKNNNQNIGLVRNYLKYNNSSLNETIKRADNGTCANHDITILNKYSNYLQLPLLYNYDYVESSDWKCYCIYMMLGSLFVYRIKE